jgi:hypothetical protein
MSFAQILEVARDNYEKCGMTGVHTTWRLRQRRGGRIVWFEARDNIWHDDGEEMLLGMAFTEAIAVPANFYLGLDDRVTLAEADNIATANAAEPAFANGYARQAVPTTTVGFTAVQDTGDWQVTTTTETFTASGGNWGTVRNLFMTDKNVAVTGKYLLASVALSTQRTINDGDSLDASMVIKVKEAT